MSTESVRFRFIRTGAGATVVNALLALTILVSPIVFIEPSPYEGMVFVVTVVAFAFGLPFERRIVPLLALLMAWAASGFLSLLPAFGDGDAVRYYLISVYLMITSFVFACLFAEDTTNRLATLAYAYIVAAVGVSLIAAAAYFGAIPNAGAFLVNNRATGTFKDPNVFAPFLILPLLLLIERVVYRGIGFRRVVATLIILCGVFLSFSRGAWGHFLFSAAVMTGLLFATDRRPRLRRRLIFTTVAAMASLVVLLAVALSIPSVREMFDVRAEVLQSYDRSARTGRFSRQLDAVEVVVEEPNGLGPMQFGHRFGQDVHNVYLNAFVAYGWVGGAAYLTIVILTLVRGLVAIRMPSPWRGYLVATYATFGGLVLEGLIVDTDHWRHFFLLVGLIWGVGAAIGKGHSTLPAATERSGARATNGRVLAAGPVAIERAAKSRA